MTEFIQKDSAVIEEHATKGVAQGGRESLANEAFAEGKKSAGGVGAAIGEAVAAGAAAGAHGWGKEVLPNVVIHDGGMHGGGVLKGIPDMRDMHQHGKCFPDFQNEKDGMNRIEGHLGKNERFGEKAYPNEKQYQKTNPNEGEIKKAYPVEGELKKAYPAEGFSKQVEKSYPADGSNEKHILKGIPVERGIPLEKKGE